MDIVTIFCDIDDFCQRLLAVPLPALVSGAGTKKSHRSARLALSEIMTILVWFHGSHYRTSKHFYLRKALGERRREVSICPATAA